MGGVGGEQEDLLEDPLRAVSSSALSPLLLRAAEGQGRLSRELFWNGDGICFPWARVSQLSAFWENYHLKHWLPITSLCWLA